MKKFYLKHFVKHAATAVTLLAINTSAFAATDTKSELPFSNTMQILQQAISGPFLLSASLIMVVVTCMMLAFGEWGDGFKKIINISLWLSIAFGATKFVTQMFGSGAVF